MCFEDRIHSLRKRKDKTSFDFTFEELYSESEWLEMNLSERKYQEREFRRFISESSYLRIPASTEDSMRMRMYNLVYSYNEIKKNFKSYV
ncbi:single-stranded DNA-binding protein [Staphylococcus sp. SQ8-PEA]|uniref:Single-stranded DNA-binding protein n=1 Tax=Staphylococcus marylandisciuri TaxID=2981529 RepID=A0ABT2QMW8_9STAP|nr:single-stranded DNA-binding protein [Staphylococcus marylandisciuri]MCU5745322.1 single-stranded DNA-binding protein [Staphylococcus marylandisciuri]